MSAPTRRNGADRRPLRRGDDRRRGTIGAKDHDFGSAGLGAVVPHGRYHVGQNEDFFRLNAIEFACDRGGSDNASRELLKEQSRCRRTTHRRDLEDDLTAGEHLHRCGTLSVPPFREAIPLRISFLFVIKNFNFYKCM